MTLVAPALDDALALGLRCVYQPVIELATGRVAGYEALLRGPAGSDLESPAALFAAAEAEGRVAELDWLARAAAAEGALAARLRPPACLFVNVEPQVLGTRCPPELEPVLERAQRELPVVVEITERELATRPAEMLLAVERIRDLRWAVALDDVGVDWRSLALLPIVRPDVVKLDRGIVQDPDDPAAEAVALGVTAYAADSGAIVLAEGIETEEHRLRALELGATHGQGWLFGRPEPLPADFPRLAPLPLPARTRADAAATPVEVAARALRLAVGTKEELLDASVGLELEAASHGESGIVFGCFQRRDRFTRPVAQRYEALAQVCSFVGAFGAGMPAEPAPGVRGASFAANDRLEGEWSVVVLAPHAAFALVGRDLGDAGPDLDRRFAHAVTDDRALVAQIARSLMARIVRLG
jgi:EAL domain-containing protein (putative c-di-GMP-specific phosphodiesterase class I)